MKQEANSKWISLCKLCVTEDETATILDEALSNAEKFLTDDLPQRFGKKFKLKVDK